MADHSTGCGALGFVLGPPATEKKENRREDVWKALDWGPAPALGILSLLFLLSSCGGEGREKTPETLGGAVIQNIGSDTMVNLAQEWAEAYRKVEPTVSVEVSGGGSGVGISSLINGTVDIANASRAMTDGEKAQARRNTGKDPMEFVVGYDAVAVYVHKDNPVQVLSIAQLREIYAEGGSIEKWSQLGVKNSQDRIVRVSRQNNSGTYVYFREHVLNKRDYKQGAIKCSGSKDVVELVGRTPGAIGYSGLGYYDKRIVKAVKTAKTEKGPAYEPSVASVHTGTYPLARPLRMYTLGPPSGAIKKYIDWILSPAGQKIVAEAGYVPLSEVRK